MKPNRVLSFILALVMLLTMTLNSMTAFAQGGTADDLDNLPDSVNENGVLFSSTFSPGDPVPADRVESAANISSTQVPYKAIDSKFTGYAATNAVVGSAMAANYYFPQAILDGKIASGANFSGSSLWFRVAFDSPVVAGAYSITTGIDGPSYQPKDWTVYGSNQDSSDFSAFPAGNLADWTQLDVQNGQNSSGKNNTTQYYGINNTTAFQYYWFQVTANYSGAYTQIAEVSIGNKLAVIGTAGQRTGLSTTYGVPFPSTTSGTTISPSGSSSDSAMQTYTYSSSTPNFPSIPASGYPWTGISAYNVFGSVSSNGAAHSYNVVYDGLNIPVSSNTRLDYKVAPISSGSFDFNYTSTYVSVDLKFSDGTYLRDSAATDQYQNPMSAIGQGNSKFLNMNEWNNVYSDIGTVANGKTITEILVDYHNPNAAARKNISIFLDDISISNVTPPDLNDDDLTNYVNILRTTNNGGENSHGTGIPAIAVPHPFNFYVPCTNGSNLPYFYQTAVSSPLRWFEISHEASKGVGENGTFQFMANTSIDTSTAVTAEQLANSGAYFSHSNEIAHPDYYSVIIDQNDVNAAGVQMELSPTSHAAEMRITFPAGAPNRNIILQSVHSTSSSQTITFSGNTFSAKTYKQAYGMQPMYVYGQLISDNGDSFTSKSVGDNWHTIVSFPSSTNVVTLKLASSFISAAQAQNNFNLELGDGQGGTLGFDAVRAAANSIWNQTLGMVSDVKGATYDQLVTLYSNIYRYNMYPNTLSENTGTSASPVWSYQSPYGTTATKTGQFYYNNGFWDTYRSVYGTMGLLQPNLEKQVMNGFLQHYLDPSSGYWLPHWNAPGAASFMFASNNDAAMAEAYSLGAVNPEDVDNIYNLLIKDAQVYTSNKTNGGRGNLDDYRFYPYMSHGTGTYTDGLSDGLENAICDAAIAEMAKALRDQITDQTSPQWKAYNDEFVYLNSRAKTFANYFNPTQGDANGNPVGWFMNRNADGSWYNPDTFDPNSESGYSQSTAWMYSAYAPQDGRGLANLYGGAKAFGDKLDSIYTAPGGGNGGSHEAREARMVRMGQLMMNNQPAINVPFFYYFSDRPWKTNAVVREVLDRFYRGNSIGTGFIGDEDNGCYAAWGLIASLGLYPFTNGSGQFLITSPLFTHAVVKTEDGNTITINAPNNSRENVYIADLKVNGQAYNKLYISKDELIGSGNTTLDFTMSSTPTTWGTAEDSVPPSLSSGTDLPSPLVNFTYIGVSSAGSSLTPSSIPTAMNGAADMVAAAGGTPDKLANLFDRSSSTSTLFAGNTADVIYYFAQPKNVTLYTMTTGTTATSNPKDWTFQASNDGTTWVTLDTRTNESFVIPPAVSASAQYTRPFAIDNTARYNYYRLSVSAASGAAPLRISEFELMGPADNIVSAKASLYSLIQQAQEADPQNFDSTGYNQLQSDLSAAKAVYYDQSADLNAVQQAISKLTIDLSLNIPRSDPSVFVPAGNYNASKSNTAGGFGSGVGMETQNNCTYYPTTVPTANSWVGNLFPSGSNILDLHNFTNNNYFAYDNIDFGKQWDKKYTNVEVLYENNHASASPYQFKCSDQANAIFYLDSVTGPQVADVACFPDSQGGTSYQTSWTKVQLAKASDSNSSAIATVMGLSAFDPSRLYGVRTVYFKPSDGKTTNTYQYLFNFIGFKFSYSTTTLSEVVNYADAFYNAPTTSSLYSAEDLAAFHDVLQASAAVNSNSSATQAEKEHARTGLINAKASLKLISTGPSVSESSVNVDIGQSVPVAIDFGSGENTASAASISVSNSKVATVDTNSLIAGGNVNITGVASGVCDIIIDFTVGNSTIRKYVAVNVSSMPTVSPEVLSMNQGDVIPINVDMGIGSTKAVSAAITSNDTAVATVELAALSSSNDVNVTAVGNGTTAINVVFTFADSSTLSKSVAVEVTNSPGVFTDTLSLVLGNNSSLGISLGQDELAATSAVLTTSDPTVVIPGQTTVSKSGAVTITPIGGGTATITVQFNDAAQTTKAVAVNVAASPSVDKKYMTLAMGTAGNINLNFGTFARAATSATITSNNPDIVSVPQGIVTGSGIVAVTPVGGGSTTLNVVFNDQARTTISITVKVGAPPSVSTGELALTLGTQGKFSVNMGKYSYAGATIIVSTSNPEVATVDASQVTSSGGDVAVTPVGAGTATLTATFDDPARTVIQINVIVSAPPSIDTTSLTMTSNGLLRTFNVNLGYGSLAATSATVYSSDPEVASVEQSTITQPGVVSVTPHKGGPATITVTFDDLAATTKTINVTVSDSPSVTMDNMDLILGGSSSTLSLDLGYGESAATGVTDVAYDENIISVDTSQASTGVVSVSPVNAGQTSMVISFNDNLSTKCTVNVTVSKSPSIDGSSLILTAGGTEGSFNIDLGAYKLAAENALIVSNDPSVATVSSSKLSANGSVTVAPVSGGSTTIDIIFDDSANTRRTVEVLVEALPGVSTDSISLTEGDTDGSFDVDLGYGSLAVASATIASGDTYVAMVDKQSLTSSGTVRVIPGSRGSTTVTVTFPDNTQKTISVTVSGRTVTPATPTTSTGPVTPANNYTADIVLPDASGSGTLNAKLPLTVNEKTGTAVLDTSANKDLAASGGTSVITVPAIPGVKAYTLSIPVSSLTTADWEGAVKVNTTAGSITIPSNMLSGVTGAAGAKAEVTIALGDRTILTGDAKAAVGDRPLLELYLSIDGKRIEWNSTAAPVNVSIPYAPSAAELSNPERIVIWYIDDSGKAHAVPNGRYDAATGKVNFTTTHFSHYAVGYNGISFKDVPDTAWYSKAVGYVAARGITSGKGNGSFSPNAKLTRGEFLVMVMKAYGFTPDENAANNFTDAGNTYYTGYLAAAKRLGISGGVGNNMFAPGKEITRQEMFTMLYNALKAIGELPQGHSGKTLSSFEDAGRIAAYAKEAMTYFVEAGIMEGNAGQLTPASTTTRAQLAQVLYNLLSRQ